MNPVIFGSAIGAFAMYFLDPQSGRRRRARTRDRLSHAARRLAQAREVALRDTAHRAQGIAAAATRLFRKEAVSDEALAGRARAALGRYVSHPHAIELACAGGRVSVAGPILAHEVRPLVRALRRVPGVMSVENGLTPYAAAGNVSSLQGGVPRPGSRFELMQDNWAPAARLAAGTLGAGMLLAAFRAKASMRALLGISGSALLARAATNYDLPSLLGLGRRGITVQKMINIEAPVERVFGFWTDFENFPRFMHNVREVRRVSDERWRWTVAGPAGVPVHWTAEVTRLQPGRCVEWRSGADSDVRHAGEARFEPNGSGGTRLNVRLSYVPPAGVLGHALAALLGADPKSEMDADLMRVKTAIETGHLPHDAARRSTMAQR